MKIELGCSKRKNGWVTVDVTGNPDVRHDLDVIPYPFKDRSVEEIRACHVLEHLKSPKRTILEIYRILTPGGIAILKVPFGTTTTKNPSHLHNFAPEWFHSFDHSRSPYNERTIGGIFKVTTKVKRGKYKLWKKYEITAVMTKARQKEDTGQ